MPSVARAVRVLQALADADEGRRLSDLSRQLRLSKSTLSGLLSTLEECSLVERDPASRAFRLGIGLVDLSAAVLRRLDIREAARPALERLRTASGETAILHVPRGPRALILDRAEPDRELTVVARVGRLLPAFAGSVAKAMLAVLPAAEVEALVGSRPLPAFTPSSIGDPERYLQEVAHVRRAGYAFDDEEYLPGVRAVSAAVVGARGQALGTLTIAGVSARTSVARMRALAPEVADAARAVARRLGTVET